MTNKVKVLDKAVIDEKEVEALKEAWTTYSAFLELIKNGIETESVLTKYQEAHKKYNELWSDILKKHFGGKYMTGADYKWNCDFDSKEVIISL